MIYLNDGVSSGKTIWSNLVFLSVLLEILRIAAGGYNLVITKVKVLCFKLSVLVNNITLGAILC